VSERRTSSWWTYNDGIRGRYTTIQLKRAWIWCRWILIPDDRLSYWNVVCRMNQNMNVHQPFPLRLHHEFRLNAAAGDHRRHTTIISPQSVPLIKESIIIYVTYTEWCSHDSQSIRWHQSHSRRFFFQKKKKATNMQQTNVRRQTAPLNVYVGRQQPENYVLSVCRQLQSVNPAPKCSHSVNINWCLCNNNMLHMNIQWYLVQHRRINIMSAI